MAHILGQYKRKSQSTLNRLNSLIIHLQVFNPMSECGGLHYLLQVFPEKRFCDSIPDEPAGPRSLLCSHQHKSAVESSAITHKQCTGVVNLAFYAGNGSIDGAQTALSHWFSVRVLPQITVAVA